MASDLWALGCILYHFLAGDFPFRGATQHHIFKKIQALDFDFPPDFDPLALDLVRKLIVLDPAARLGWCVSLLCFREIVTVSYVTVSYELDNSLSFTLYKK